MKAPLLVSVFVACVTPLLGEDGLRPAKPLRVDLGQRVVVRSTRTLGTGLLVELEDRFDFKGKRLVRVVERAEGQNAFEVQEAALGALTHPLFKNAVTEIMQWAPGRYEVGSTGFDVSSEAPRVVVRASQPDGGELSWVLVERGGSADALSRAHRRLRVLLEVVTVELQGTSRCHLSELQLVTAPEGGQFLHTTSEHSLQIAFASRGATPEFAVLAQLVRVGVNPILLGAVRGERFEGLPFNVYPFRGRLEVTNAGFRLTHSSGAPDVIPALQAHCDKRLRSVGRGLRGEGEYRGWLVTDPLTSKPTHLFVRGYTPPASPATPGSVSEELEQKDARPAVRGGLSGEIQREDFGRPR